MLWFLPILYIVSVGTYPLLGFSRRRRKDKRLGWRDLYFVILQIFVLLGINFAYYKAVSDSAKFWNHMFPQICILWGSFFAFFVL